VNKKLLIIALAGLGLLAFLHFAPRGLFSLESLKAGQQAWQAEYHRTPALFLGGYFLIYVVMTAISFPGAAVMTLAGGAFFGVFVGTLLVSFASLFVPGLGQRAFWGALDRTECRHGARRIILPFFLTPHSGNSFFRD
jgi:hypothetical protein